MRAELKVKFKVREGQWATRHAVWPNITKEKWAQVLESLHFDETMEMTLTCQ